MVGFRNILVHDCTRLDPAIVIRVLRTDLTDLERFRDACGRWFSDSPEAQPLPS
jgi:uncharacterized protein YutE (UPF0331/DUF86 family)